MIETLTVSAIIPCYNSSNTIVRCLDSIMSQTRKIDEIIIIDDGSTDNTVQIIRNYLELSTVKNKILLQRNSGPSIARNYGVSNCTSKYVAFLDSDDEWLNQHLETLCNYVTAWPNCEIYSNKYLSAPIMYTGLISLEKLLFKNYFLTPCVLVKTITFKNMLGFSKEMKHAEDYDLWLRICCISNGYLGDYIGGKNIDNKMPFGESGLSSNLVAMHKGILDTYKYLYKQKDIPVTSYLLAVAWEHLKFGRRLIKTFIHRFKQ